MLFFHVWVGDAECMLQSGNPNAQNNWPCTLLPSGPPSLCRTSISWCLTSLTSSMGMPPPSANGPMHHHPPPSWMIGLQCLHPHLNRAKWCRIKGTGVLVCNKTRDFHTPCSYSFHHQQISLHLGCNKAIHLHHGVAGHLQVVCNLFKCNKICIGIDNSNKSRAYHLLHPLGLQVFHHIWPAWVVTFTRFELKLHDHCLITFKLSDIPRTLLGV